MLETSIDFLELAKKVADRVGGIAIISGNKIKIVKKKKKESGGSDENRTRSIREE